MEVTQKNINFLKEPKECFFRYHDLNKCPGWVIGEIRLPLVLHSNLFLLIQSFSGELYWMPGNKVTFHEKWNFRTRNIAPLPPNMDKWNSL